MCLHFLKPRSIFLIGFGIGFSFALLLLLAENIFHDVPTCKRKTWEDHSERNVLPQLLITKSDERITFQNWFKQNWAKELENVTYHSWLKNQNFKARSIDMDPYVYNSENEGILLESEWLTSRVHVICVVFVEKIKLAKAIAATWGSKCNDLYFFGQHLKDADIPVINVDQKLTSSWQLLCEVMNYIWKRGNNLEWVIFVKDDTVVIPENLRYMVAPLDYKEDHYLGHPVVMWGQPYNIAQSGYVLSKGAFQKIVDIFDTPEKCAAGGKYWKKEDYYLGKHLSSMGIHPTDTRDQYLRGTFNGYSLQNLLWGIAKPGSYWTRALYPVQGECCSSRSITFSAGEPDKMYTLNYILYRLRLFYGEGVFGNKPAPTAIPDEEVWKIALKEEFNITDLKDISSDNYYEIWHSKYTEPEELIVKNYQHMPDVLSSILTAYELEKSADKSSPKQNESVHNSVNST